MTRFYHINVPSNTLIWSRMGVLTLAIEEGKFGVAWCSPSDQFNKKKGRTIAEGRLRKKPVTVDEHMLPFSPASGCLITLMRHPSLVPGWVRAAMHSVFRKTGRPVLSAKEFPE